MCTVIKVKRKITDDPADCLILECKKKKLQLDKDQIKIEEDNKLITSTASSSKNVEEDRIDSIKQVLKYAGSANNETEISAILSKSLKQRTKESRTNSLSILKESLLKENKKETKSHRYVLLNQKRGLSEEQDLVSNNSTSSKSNATSLPAKDLKKINIIDVISSEYVLNENLNSVKSEKLTCNGVEMIREKITTPKQSSDEYVYDIYYTKNMDIHLDLLYPNNFEIKSLTNIQHLELIDDSHPEDPDAVYEDDEDSNDECNWRNDYPDEDEHSIDDEDGKEYDDYEDDYNEYGYGDDYDYDDDDRKLSSYMKKSCLLDRSYNECNSENEDYDEYDGETSKSYSEYKKRLLKELENDH